MSYSSHAAREPVTIRLGDRGRPPRCLEHPAQRGGRYPRRVSEAGP
jgi:hypothetical protein